MLTSTLRQVALPIVQYLIMFMVAFMAFAAMAHFIMGREMEDFSTLMRAMETLFAAMLSMFTFVWIYLIILTSLFSTSILYRGRKKPATET